MREDEPRDPSLALCQICGMNGEMGVYAAGCDGKPRHYRTCFRFTFGNCNDFVPINNFDLVKGGMERRAKYGRFY